MQPKKEETGMQRAEVRELTPANAADVDMLAVIERRNALLERILKYAISATHSGQWTDQDGKPYPGAAAAEVMARRCAVRIDNVSTNKVPSTDDKGPFYLYVSTCTASLPGGYDSIQAIGTFSSRNSFLGTETRAGRMLSEIDEGDILKGSYSNMLVNAITRLLGVRNLTWEQLAEFKITREGAAKVEYHSGSKGGGGTTGLTVKFGKDKGKTLEELDESSLAFHLKAAKESVAKNDPKWHAKNEEWLKAVEAEHARRRPVKADAPATGEPGAWDQILAACTEREMTKDQAWSFCKGATGKIRWQELTAADVEAVRAALKNRPQSQDEAAPA